MQYIVFTDFSGKKPTKHARKLNPCGSFVYPLSNNKQADLQLGRNIRQRNLLEGVCDFFNLFN